MKTMIRIKGKASQEEKGRKSFDTENHIMKMGEKFCGNIPNQLENKRKVMISRKDLK